MGRSLIGRLDRAAATLQCLVKEVGRLLSGFFSPLLPEPRVAGTLHQILHDPFPEEVGEGHPIDLGLSVAFPKRVGVWLSDKDEIALFGCIASRESSSICLPNPLLSCSSLTGPYRLKRFHSLSPNSKPVLSQRQEDDRREAGSDESVTSAFRRHGNSRDPVSEKRENVPLSHRWKLRIPRLFFTERLSFCSLSLAWISTGLFLRHLSIKPLRSLSASARGAIGHASADIV